MTIDANDIVKLCSAYNINFNSGVPCSLLSSMTNTIEASEEMRYVNATNEGEAVAIAAGAWLAGQQAGIWIQNSGLGNTINPVTSLLSPFEIPVLYVTSRRGKPGVNDEPQHQLMGKITSDILTSCQITHDFLSDVSDLDTLFQTVQSHFDQRQSYGIVVDKGCVEKQGYVPKDKEPASKKGVYQDLRTSPASLASRYDILGHIVEVCDTDMPIIATTGKTGRELYTIRDSANHFYMVGSMGYASSIGLGVAMNSTRRTVVIDGDGALLMNLGTLATIGHMAPSNLIHIVIDNGLYESTGGQPTTSSTVDFAALAHHAGYKHAVTLDTATDFIQILDKWVKDDHQGPSLVCIKTSVKKIDDLARPSVHPRDVAIRFRDHIKNA